MKQYIVTHPGAVHRDELLAVALILARVGMMAVYRRNPLPEELENPDVWVVDVGMRHEPELRNFDHHQFEKDAEPECAFSLVAKFFGLEESFQYQLWYESTKIGDSKGPRALAAHVGLDELPKGLTSPIELGLKALFGKEQLIKGEYDGVPDGGTPHWDPVLLMLHDLGRHLVTDAKAFAEAMMMAPDYIIQVGRVKGYLVDVIVNSTYTAGLGAWRDRNDRDIQFSITRSGRDGVENWVLFRYPGVELDFAQLADHPDVTFAHKGGFLAALRPGLCADEAIDILRTVL